MSSSVVHLPKSLDVIAKIEGGSPLAAVLCHPTKTKKVSDLMVRLKGESKRYNLAHFYNYYTKRFNISKRFSISTVGFYGVLGCLFVGDRSIRELLTLLKPAELAQLGQKPGTPVATVATVATGAVVDEMASFEAAVHKQMVSGSAVAPAVAPATATATATATTAATATATAEPITEASLTAAVMVALEKQVRAALVEAFQPATTTATATAAAAATAATTVTEDEETEEEKLCAIDDYLGEQEAAASLAAVDPHDEPTFVPLPPFPSIPKEERDKESAQLKDLALGDTEVLIASKTHTTAVTLKADGTFTYRDIGIDNTFSLLHSSELMWYFNKGHWGNEILRKPLEHIYCGVYTLAAHLQHKDKTLPVVPVVPIKPRVTQELRDAESSIFRDFLVCDGVARRLEVRYKDAVMSSCSLQTDGTFTFVDHNEVYYFNLCALELIWHFNERLFRLGPDYDPIVSARPLDHIYFVASPRQSLGRFLEEASATSTSTSTSTPATAAAATATSTPATAAAATATSTAPTLTSTSTSGEHQPDCHCYAFPDEDYDDYDEEGAEPPLHVLSIPESVRSQEIALLRQFAHGCESTKVYVMNNMVADITLESDGTFSLYRPSQQVIADLNSLEVLYLLSPQTTASRELFEARAHSDPTYALDQFTFASNPWKSLAVLVAEKEDEMAVANAVATATSPAALLEQEKAKEAELRAEIELWRAVRAQQQINKDLEKQLAALKELA